MFCEKCGTKNAKENKFCGKCGNPLAEPGKTNKNSKNIEQVKNKWKKIPKKTKIITGIVVLVIIIAVIVLCILLNNPVKKVEDGLERYYTNYSENNTQELAEIGDILKSNKEKEDVLNSIKETAHKTMSKWITNFNTEYKNEDELEDAYEKVYGALKDIYNYYDGLKYMLDYETYYEYYNNLSDLYSSKYNYLKGKEYEEDNNDYYAYYYYQKVIEEDSYYDQAQEYVNNYVKEEIEEIKTEAEALIKTDENSTNEEILECYINQIKYLNNHKTVNYIDLTSTESYKELYENAAKKLLEYTKKIVEEEANDYDYAGAIKTIETSMNSLNKDSDYYKELSELKKTYEDKMPDKLIEQYRVSYHGAGYSSWSKQIDGKEYDHYVYFTFDGETQSVVYRLNNEYTKFKTTIVRGSDWDKSFSGYFVIYGDDKELYRSDEITKSSELKSDIDIDVTGVDDLKIEFVTESESDSWDSFYIYLVEPYLYK